MKLHIPISAMTQAQILKEYAYWRDQEINALGQRDACWRRRIEIGVEGVKRGLMRYDKEKQTYVEVKK